VEKDLDKKDTLFYHLTKWFKGEVSWQLTKMSDSE
jgi:hypothetical protein